jgi:hypothetical protein
MQVPRLTAFLRANAGGSGALDAGALYLQRKQELEARLGIKHPVQVGHHLNHCTTKGIFDKEDAQLLESVGVHNLVTLVSMP